MCSVHISYEQAVSIVALGAAVKSKITTIYMEHQYRPMDSYSAVLV